MYTNNYSNVLFSTYEDNFKMMKDTKEVHYNNNILKTVKALRDISVLTAYGEIKASSGGAEDVGQFTDVGANVLHSGLFD